MANVNDLLDPLTGAGWSIWGVSGINDIGQIVGGGAYDPDGPGGLEPIYRAVLLTPVPEPLRLAPFALAFVAAAMSLRHRSRRFKRLRLKR
jgi:hypothetical protein